MDFKQHYGTQHVTYRHMDSLLPAEMHNLVVPEVGVPLYLWAVITGRKILLLVAH